MLETSKGYCIVDGDLSVLEGVRRIFFNTLGPMLSIEQEVLDIERFDEILKGLRPSALNDIRLKLIDKLSSMSLNGDLVKSFLPHIEKIIGPDILLQGGVNLVLQPPGDPNPSDFHRDTPGNSPFELVCWVPLVDCFESSTMYLVPAEHSVEITKGLKLSNLTWGQACEHSERHRVFERVCFGQALLFWSGLWHGSVVNREKFTRYSFNFRVKSPFTPNGLKDASRYFQLYKLSSFSALGISEL